MNTLREADGYPPEYPTVKDSEVPVLVSNKGRLLVSQKPAGFGTFNLMTADKYVKMPHNEASELRLSNNTLKDVAVINTWESTVLGDFDKAPYEDGKTVHGVNGWEGDGYTTPDVNDENDPLRSPVLDILQGRRSVLVEGKLTKAVGQVPDDGSKIASLFRPRTTKRNIGLGMYDGSKNLVLGIYTKDGVFGIAKSGVDVDTSVEVTSDIVRMEIVFAPSTGLYKAYVYQGKGRELVFSETLPGISSSSLNYSSFRVGTECEGAIVDQFIFYQINQDRPSFEVLASGTSATYPVIDSVDEVMVKSLGSSVKNYQDNNEPVFISGFYSQS